MKRGAVLALALFALACRPAPAAPTVAIEPVSSAFPVAFARLEFDLQIRGGASPYANPFDPDEIRVDATAAGPGGRMLAIPGFWHQPCRREGGWMKPTGEAARFRVRFAPLAPGIWLLRVAVRDRSGVGRSAPLRIAVAPGRSKGFLERAPRSRRYFQNSADRSPAFLIGENACWAGERGLQDYDDWFPALAQAGGNFARLWMAWQQIETKESGRGRYDLSRAAYFDEILALADRRGIRCMLAFMTYGELATGGYFNEGRWPESPYNAAQGGPVPTNRPDDFFTHETARRLYRQRLRYLIARYGAFTSLGFWEFWNEKDAPAAWLAEMGGYLKANDPYRHLVTNSYTTTGRPEQHRLPEIDLTQTHRYGDEGSIIDFAPLIAEDTYAHDRYAKPHLMGEFGISWRNPDAAFDPAGTATNLHNGLWASALSGAAGGAAIWWWDNYIHPKRLYREFTGLAKFAAAIPWTRRDFQPLTVPASRRVSHEPETFSDLVLTPGGGWGIRPRGTVMVGRDGQVQGGILPGFLYGPAKPELRAPLTLAIDLPRPGKLTLRIGSVSDRATLSVRVDGAPAAEFALQAAPNAGQDFESTRSFAEYGGIYQAVFNKDRAVLLPAGRHRVALENREGDWVSILRYTLEGAKSSRAVALRTIALQDAATAETLVWLQDPESHWANDRDGRAPALQRGVTLRIPFPKSVLSQAEWWDTRTGARIARQSVRAENGRALLIAPPFRRDIALRLTRK